MVQLYAKGTTDFSKNGIELRPQESTVTFQDNGQFTFDMVVPAEGGYTAFDYGQFIKATVPRQELEAISLGEVSYYTVGNAEGATIYSEIPTLKHLSYKPWSASGAYMGYYNVGQKVTYNSRNYRLNSNYDPSSGQTQVPPPNSWWDEIPRTTGKPGKVAATLEQGDVVMKTADFNNEYMEVASLDGKVGYIRIDDCISTGNTEERIVPARSIKTQLFLITEIRKEQNGKTIRIAAEHISYQLGRTILGECNVTNVTPATALLFIGGAMKEEFSGNLYTDMEEPAVTADWSWKNAQNAVMDPKNGLLALAGGRMIRDNLDVFILTDIQQTPSYSVRYGANMKNVRWTGNVDGLVTRIYPTAQTEDGSTLLLPEEYIDTVRTVPFIKPEVLNTGLKIGQTVKNSDGTESVLSEDDVYDRMRQAAANRFNVDKVDQAEIKLELDWQHMPDTEEYAQYKGLLNAAPGEWVEVKNGPLGISELIRMTGYTWDPMLEIYKSATFGDQKQKPTVAGYNIKSGSVGSSALAAGAVGSGAIQQGVITAREIETNSLTADLIASRSITTELIMANAITSNEITASAITADKIAAGAVTAGAIAAQAIETVHLAADSVTAAKIAAGAVEAAKIAALAVTAEKIAAGAVEADKIASGAINAGKIDTTDLAAINATLGTADIADARIALADIDFAQVKDLNAQSAYFGQAVIQEGLANKLYIPRLAANYAQIVNATISDLVIQATNDNFYKLDVDLSGNVTATQISPTAEEIEDGHTSDGRTIYMGTDIVAEDLNTMNIYASHALMDEITANLLNVDKLFAREATIAKINAMDLSSNTYIRSVVGDWVSGSTITQTINAINTRITSLGYGTFYYSEVEPSHEGLVAGDVWIKPEDANSWGDIANNYTWGDLAEMTWDEVLGKYEMYCWTGQRWKLLYDSRISANLQTQINQNAYAITLKADETEVNLLSGQVTEFAGELEVQSRTISAAVETVNAKVSNFVQATDPTEDYEVHIGDTWTKTLGNGTWNAVKEFTWRQLSEFTWGDIGGSKVYAWNGEEWVLTTDSAVQKTVQSEVEILDSQVSIMSEEQVVIGNQVIRNTADIIVQTDRITQEVERATSAEAGKIAKTEQYQTADEIYSAAVSQAASAAASLYLAKTTSYQTAEAIVTEAVRQSTSVASGTFIAKTSAYQTADAIVTEAVRQSSSYATGAFIAKTSAYQTADAIVTAAETYTNGKLTDYSTTSQTASQIAAYVGNNAYGKISGIAITSAGVDVSGSQYVKIASGGYLSALTGDFGIDTSQAGVCMWAGAANSANANFKVKKNGEVTVTKLLVLNESGVESEVNLRTAGLWKLNYSTIKTYSLDGSYVSSLTLSGGTVLNFKSAAAAHSEGYAEAASVSYSRRNGNTVSCQIPTSSGGVSASSYTASTDNSFAIHWGASRVIDGNVYVLARDTYLTGSAWVVWS